jgi:hypothetical protein
MITFFVMKDEIMHTYECSVDDTLTSLKERIMKDYNIQDKYIDIEYLITKPIRVLGKFNVEPGMVPRTLDRYPFNRYGLEGKTIKATFHVVDDYQQKTYIKKEINHGSGVYKPPMNIESGESYIKDPLHNFDLDLQSDKDFPTLGGT